MQLFHRNNDIIKTICYKTPEQSCFRGLLLSDNYFLSVLYIYSRSEGRFVYSSSVEVIDDIVVDNRSISHGANACSCLVQCAESEVFRFYLLGRAGVV